MLCLHMENSTVEPWFYKSQGTTKCSDSYLRSCVQDILKSGVTFCSKVIKRKSALIENFLLWKPAIFKVELTESLDNWRLEN